MKTKSVKETSQVPELVANPMFSIRQKREIAEAVQRILRETGHPELPQGEIEFTLHVHGAEDWSYAMIRNNAAVIRPGMNPHNEASDPRTAKGN